MIRTSFAKKSYFFIFHGADPSGSAHDIFSERLINNCENQLRSSRLSAPEPSHMSVIQKLDDSQYQHKGCHK